MKCPRDQTELVRAQYEAMIEIDRCPSCNGVFLDRGELEGIQSSREHDHQEEVAAAPDLVGQAHAMALASTRPAVDCPKCDSPMERREHGYTSQILIDCCPQCGGMWLDDGELEALEVFFERVSSPTREARSRFFKGLVRLLEKTPRPPRL